MPKIEAEEYRTLEDDLVRLSEAEYGGDYRAALLEQYKLCVEMADRVSQRRQSANSFYLSINTALFGAISLFTQHNIGIEQSFFLSAAGSMLCIMWLRNIESYGTLNSGKFAVIVALEKFLPVAPYDEEWNVLERGQNNSRYKPFRKVERAIPWLFISIYALLFLGRLDLIGDLKALCATVGSP